MANENDRIYQELLNRIIETQKDLYGELAIKTASKVKELEISEDGKVLKISGSIKDVIRDLICAFEVLGGKLSKLLGDSVLKAYHKNYPSLTLPEN